MPRHDSRYGSSSAPGRSGEGGRWEGAGRCVLEGRRHPAHVRWVASCPGLLCRTAPCPELQENGLPPHITGRHWAVCPFPGSSPTNPPLAPPQAALTLHSVVVHHVQDDLNPRRMQRPHHLLELAGSCCWALAICGQVEGRKRGARGDASGGASSAATGELGNIESTCSACQPAQTHTLPTNASHPEGLFLSVPQTRLRLSPGSLPPLAPRTRPEAAHGGEEVEV